MTVYVDDLRRHPRARHRCLRAGACHLMADAVFVPATEQAHLRLGKALVTQRSS